MRFRQTKSKTIILEYMKAILVVGFSIIRTVHVNAILCVGSDNLLCIATCMQVGCIVILNDVDSGLKLFE